MVDATEAQLKAALAREKTLAEKLYEESNENRRLKSALADVESNQLKAATPHKVALVASHDVPLAPDEVPASPHSHMAEKVAHDAIKVGLLNHASPRQAAREAVTIALPTSVVKGDRPNSGTDSARRISFSVDHTDNYLVGTKVSANFGNSGQWYTGKIAKVHGAGAARTFDVNYDDGDVEQAKPLADVKVLPAVAGTAPVMASEELLALRAEVKDLKSKVSLLEMTVRAKAQDLESLNKEFLSDAMEIDRQRNAAEKKFKAVEKQAAEAFAEIVLLKAQLDDAQISASAAESALLSGGQFKPDSSVDNTGDVSISSSVKGASKLFNPNASLQSINSSPSERGSTILDAKSSEEIISRYEARLATVEASSCQKVELAEREKAYMAVKAELEGAQTATEHTLGLLRSLELKGKAQQVVISEREASLEEQRCAAYELQARLSAALDSLKKSEPSSMRASPLMLAQVIKEAKEVEPAVERPELMRRVLWRPREGGESNGRRPYSATASRAEKNASVHMQRIVRGFLGRLAAKHVIIERSAQLHGILVAFRPAGTIQGQAGWYVAKGDLFYFALDKGEFVLVAGPLSARDYDAILADMQASSIVARSEVSGEIDVDRMGLHAVRWQLKALKAQLDVANYELGPEGALHKYIDALKADIRDHSKQVAQWNGKEGALQGSLTAQAANLARIEGVLAAEKEKFKQVRADMCSLKQELEIERMGSKSRSGSEEQLYSPRGGDSSAVMMQAKAQVIRSAKKLQTKHFISIVIFQSYVRRFLVARRLYQQRIRELAHQTSVLMALPGTMQGEAGWYMAPDGYIYYFVHRHNEWIMAAGPLGEEKYYEVLDMSVRVAPGAKYARVASSPAPSKRSRNSVIKKDGALLVSAKKRGHHVPTVSDALIKCKFELSVERPDLDGDVFMDKRTKALYLAVSVERLIHHSALYSNACALNALKLK